MTPSTPISLADVRTALADTDPSSTNANALRQILGRGSFATIQKHLDAIRAERAPVVPIAPGATPPAPADAVALIWSTAWAQAQVVTLGRLEVVTVERDTAQALAATRAQDVSGLSAEIDSREAAATAQAAAHAQELAASNEQAIQATAQAEALKAEVTALQAEIDRHGQAAALAARDATIERQTLQAALDRQMDKYSELKAVVSQLSVATGKAKADKP